MDGQESVARENKHDHLKQIPGVTRPDGELLRRVTVRFQINNDVRVIQA